MTCFATDFGRPSTAASARPSCKRIASCCARLAALGLLAGCMSDEKKRIIELEGKVDVLTRQVKDQSKDLLSKEDLLREQQGRLQVLAALGGDRRYDHLNKPGKIEIEERSSGSDTDGKAGHDEVRVYVRVVDDDGDVVKALGAVQLQVLDLANPPTHFLVCEQKWTPQELRKCWYGRFGFQHFRLVGKWVRSQAPRHTGLTVRVVFVDVLTGKRFEAQKLINIQLPSG